MATAREIVISVAVGVVAATVVFMRTKLRSREKGSPLTKCTAPPGRAAILRLDSVDRTDNPGGRNERAPPGRRAAHYLTATHQSVVSFEELMVHESSFVLYSVEDLDSASPFLVFLSLPPDGRRQMWLEEPFIDRGVRKLVKLGSEVAIASLETAEAFANSALARFAAGEWHVSFVWNTGRCGSTLMHKAVSAMGTASFSEPHWLDQLHFCSGVSEERMARAVSVCVGIEALTAQLQTSVPGWDRPTNFVFNPKAGGLPVAEAAVTAFPLARHAFMYRACHKVVASFAGLKLPRGVPLKMTILWRLLGLRALGLSSKAVNGLPLAELSSLPVAMLTWRWIEQVDGWIAAVARRAETRGAADPIASAIVLRMDEFTSKDLALRSRIVRTSLAHFRVIDETVSDADIARALSVFSVHSQAGSIMSGPKAKVVTDGDVEVIKRCVLNALAERADVQERGANIALPESLGIA